MKIEISAGGIVFKKTGQTCKILLIKDKNDNWTFPKGLIEKGEDQLTAAKREIAEETGVKNLKYLAPLSSAGYFYKWKDSLVKKTVCYFLFEAEGDDPLTPQREEGIKEVKWFNLEKVLGTLGYLKTNEPILNEVKNVLANLVI